MGQVVRAAFEHLNLVSVNVSVPEVLSSFSVKSVFEVLTALNMILLSSRCVRAWPEATTSELSGSAASVWSGLSVVTRLFLSDTSNMAASAASRELFTEGVRAVLHTWPVLQVNIMTKSTPGGQVTAGRGHTE